MKNIIIDTDIGIDSDDAVALAILCNAHREGKCRILCACASSAREGASGALRGFLDFYGLHDIPVGRMKHEPLKCDEKNVYALALKEKFGSENSSEDAASLMRRVLSEADGKVTLCSIGPLSNIAELLASCEDESSSVKGIELVKEKVSEYYLMGGAFEGNMTSYRSDGEVMTEWNIDQDINSAIFTAKNCPVPMYYCPWEIGSRVKTYMENKEHPMFYAMRLFAKDAGERDIEKFSRPSWDPITCMWAIGGYEKYIASSNGGVIEVNGQGKTVYSKKDGGNHFYMLAEKSNLEELEKIMNELAKKAAAV